MADQAGATTRARKTRAQIVDELGDLGSRLRALQISEAREAWARVERSVEGPPSRAGGRPAGPVRTPPVLGPPGPVASGSVSGSEPDGTPHRSRLFALAPIGIFLASPDARIVECNRAVERVWQRPRDRLIGVSLSELVRPADAPALLADFRRLLSPTPASFQAHLDVPRPGGTDIPIELTVSPFADGDGAASLWIATLEDTTGRGRRERALLDENTRLAGWVEELEQRTRQISLLSEMGDLLQACRTPEEAYAVIARMARLLFPTGSGSVCVINTASSLVEAVAVWGPAVGERLFGPDDCWALRRGRLHRGQETEQGLLCRHLQQAAAAAAVCAPMMAHGEALGVLTLSLPAGDPMSDGRARLAMTVAEHIALALANLRLHDRLRSQSIRDPLTNLFNRRYMEESLEREMRRATRGRYPVGVIMLDLDHFKRVNDASGHEAGDTVLREIGAVLQRSIRGEDIACRRGGEEFALILPEASLADAARRAEQLREAIRTLNVSYRRQSLGRVTASLGVAIFPDHGPTAEGVLRAADAALYQAKEWGRDRVAVNPGSAPPSGPGREHAPTE